jgi:CRP-like cAMP-binding protein
VRHYTVRELIFSPDPSPESVYLLEEGLVRIYRVSESGAELTLGYVGEGEVFGELSSLDHVARESFAEAVRPSVVWKIPRLEFKRLTSKLESLSLCITLRLGERLKKVEMRIEDLVFRDVRGRMARVLLELAADFGRPLEGKRGIAIDVPLTQSALGMLIGATRQSINEGFRDLRELGLIGRSDRRVVLYKPEELRRIAEL